ncbi:MAG TPA: bifunctional 3-deoxy-7-phosphoheptulonate synthase/chorismate mutase type II [Chitinophagales bacterium]|nr:bifunctional 3-deoxy-7-phosphoheptulonate synthase/chorismate mutase type II [Chitinophagales bacterium]
MSPSGNIDFGDIKTSRPFLIAGPCSAETEEQVMETARSLKPLNIALFRSGIWKPRTRPGAFEGIGAVGLKWLQRVKHETGLRVAVEVAKTKHVELCLKHGIDVLWIGARSTVNPFTVQEIADALKGVDIPVMVKNPVNPDLNLWIGAMERIQNAGIKNVLAIHRGFSSIEKTKYRNQPMWEIPIELKGYYPGLPMICDPSHICGRRDLLQQVAQQAMDLNFDGLMIETHPHPDKAWSDREQQVTPEGLKMLLENLNIREKGVTTKKLKATLEELRELVDKHDDELIRALKERMDVIEQIGLFKKENNIAVLQPERWHEIAHTRTELAKELGLSDELILKIFQLIHQESIRQQTEILNRESSPAVMPPLP